MKRAMLMALAIMMTPALILAQNRWSVSPTIGFYKAKLDALSDNLSTLETLGASVHQPNGSFHFGGRLQYEKSPRWSWLAETSIWQDQGGGNIRDNTASLDFEDRVRLIPVMVGSKYNFNTPESKLRLYAGATGGIVLVNVKSRFNLFTPETGQISDESSSTGNDFISRPFVGAEIANNGKMFFWAELGYVIGKFSFEISDPTTGDNTQEKVSINGLHVTSGVRVKL